VARLNAANAPKPILARATRPFAPWSVSAQAFRDSILVSLARTAVGTRYVRGGQSFASGFDCSGLVRYVMSALEVPVPRTAAQQAGVGVPLGRDAGRLHPGDLLTFGRRGRDVSHVGIYVGNGRYVHASSVAGRVIESDIDRPQSPLVKAWRGTRRVLSDASADSTLKGDS
jgi:cell wall-associated NlpC family hydrolase